MIETMASRAAPTTAGPAVFGYDANGNLTSDGSMTMVYDAENRLVSASGASTVALSYDPMGRLFQTSGGAHGTTQFLYGVNPGTQHLFQRRLLS